MSHTTFVARHRVWPLAVALVTLLAGQRAAHAGEPEVTTSWYGWQTLLGDLSIVGAGMLGAATDTPLIGTVGAMAYFVGAPAIHLSHRQGNRATISLGLRLGLPLVGLVSGLLIGAGTCHSDSEIPCPLVTAGLGGIAGMGAAILIDAAFVAWEPVTPSTPPRLRTAFVPSVGGGTLVLGGRF